MCNAEKEYPIHGRSLTGHLLLRSRFPSRNAQINASELCIYFLTCCVKLEIVLGRNGSLQFNEH